MVTDRYQHIRHHDTVDALVDWAGAAGLPLLGVDNLPGSTPLESAELPLECVLVFGQEGPGLSDAARAACLATYSIAQYGSTRSINAGAAAAIAMHPWVRQHAPPREPSAGAHADPVCPWSFKCPLPHPRSTPRCWTRPSASRLPTRRSTSRRRRR